MEHWFDYCSVFFLSCIPHRSCSVWLLLHMIIPIIPTINTKQKMFLTNSLLMSLLLLTGVRTVCICLKELHQDYVFWVRVMRALALALGLGMTLFELFFMMFVVRFDSYEPGLQQTSQWPFFGLPVGDQEVAAWSHILTWTSYFCNKLVGLAELF